MTKVILVGDIHVTDRPPINCTDSYTDDILDILIWVAREARAREAEAVIWAGDIFHHKAPSATSHSLVLKVASVVKMHLDLGVELLIVPGNHDMSQDRLESVFQKQPLGVLYQAGATELIGFHKTLPLYGVPWQQQWDERLHEVFSPWRALGEGTKDMLAVTHAPIFPPALARNVPYEHLPAEDVARAMGGRGSLYYGHIHDYHGTFEVDGVTFANVGSVSRGSLTESHLTREVKVLEWEDGKFTEEIVPPQKPASEVFLVEEGLARKAERQEMDRWLDNVSNVRLDNMFTTRGVIEAIESQKDIPAPVKAVATDLLEWADTTAVAESLE